ncbi:12726_t:CDS:1, partial [Ambispora gerdemannii]
MSKHTKNLIKDLTESLKNSDDYNVNIIVGENSKIRKFQAHSFMLRARSPYFR